MFCLVENWEIWWWTGKTFFFNNFGLCGEGKVSMSVRKASQVEFSSGQSRPTRVFVMENFKLLKIYSLGLSYICHIDMEFLLLMWIFCHIDIEFIVFEYWTYTYDFISILSCILSWLFPYKVCSGLILIPQFHSYLHLYITCLNTWTIRHLQFRACALVCYFLRIQLLVVP